MSWTTVLVLCVFLDSLKITGFLPLFLSTRFKSHPIQTANLDTITYFAMAVDSAVGMRPRSILLYLIYYF